MRSLDDTITIEAGKKSALSFKELMLYRELLYFFAWRDIKVRYKQTYIGAGWAILQPVLATVIFTLFFNKVAGIKSGSSVPYPIFAYLGLMYWNAFSSALSTISNSLVNNSGVITKIYFPRLIPPLSAGILSVVDFFFAGLVFGVMLLLFGVVPNPWGLLAALAGLIMIMAYALGLGTFFAAVNVKYRDVRSALPFVTQIMLFVTPVIYPVELIPEKYRLIAYLNPATGAISGVRAGLFGAHVDVMGLVISAVVTVALVIFGIWYFKRTEKNFADIV